MGDEPRRVSRTRRLARGRRIAAAVAVAGVMAVATVVLAGCLADAGRSLAPGAPAAVGGFPIGSFAKELQEPELGHVRLVWTFAQDGRWVEVPFALDGQAAPMTPVRGTWTADGDALTISTDWPPDWGTSTHRWRRDGDRLWTVFVSSDLPADRDWFLQWDSQPWVPVT